MNRPAMNEDIIHIYSSLKNEYGAAPRQDVAETEADFFHAPEVRRLFLRLGIVPNDATRERAIERINRAIAITASRTGDPEDAVRAVFRRHASREGKCGESPSCHTCAIQDRCRHRLRRPTIKDLPKSERPRERLIEGGEQQLSDAELLAILIGGGTPGETAIDLARSLLSRFGGLRALAQTSVAELRDIAGIGPAKAARIKAALAIARRFSTEPLPEGAKLRGSADLFQHFCEQCRDLKKETFWIVLLDQKHRIIRTVRISEGSLSQSLVHPREVFSPAIRDSAAVVAFVHNHPSGDPEPSPEDVQITKRLAEVGQTVGIRVLDHVIVGRDTYVSFAERKML